MLVTLTRWRRWVGVVDDGGCERVGFGVVDLAQIDRRCLPTIDLGVVNNPKLLWDSVLLNSGNAFLPDDSRNDSGGI